jgi:ornithine cyclodeaminase/alanine dehydrogenase-like protein (mu-crystallin family)
VGVAGPLRQEGSEIPLSLLESSLLYVDSWTKFEGLWDYGYAPRIEGELGDVMLGRTPGRRSSDDITIFKPVGMAFEDVVSARVVLERVKREGSGISVEW